MVSVAPLLPARKILFQHKVPLLDFTLSAKKKKKDDDEI